MVAREWHHLQLLRRAALVLAIFKKLLIQRRRQSLVQQFRNGTPAFAWNRWETAPNRRAIGVRGSPGGTGPRVGGGRGGSGKHGDDEGPARGTSGGAEKNESIESAKDEKATQRGENTSEWTWNVGEDVIANGTLDVVVVELLRHEAWEFNHCVRGPANARGRRTSVRRDRWGRPRHTTCSLSPESADWRPFDDADCRSTNLQRQCIAIRSPSLPRTLTEGLAGSFNHGSLWFICFETDALARRAGDHPRRQLAAGTTKLDIVFLLRQHSCCQGRRTSFLINNSSHGPPQRLFTR